MYLSDMSTEDLIKLRRGLPSNSLNYRKVCAELSKRQEEQPDNEEIMKDFLGHEMITS